jgi:hypothetical protein
MKYCLQVLVQVGCRKIPQSLICERWTRDAKTWLNQEGENPEEIALRIEDNATLHALAYGSAMELVSMCRCSRRAFEIGVDYMSRAKQAISTITTEEATTTVNERGQPNTGNVAQQTPDDSTYISMSNRNQEQDTEQNVVNVLAPPRVVSRGRPKQSRLKSPIESPGSSKRPRTSNTADDHNDSLRRSSRLSGHAPVEMELDDEEILLANPDIRAGRAKPRKCHQCGQYGHYRNTCGRKSSYNGSSI